MLYPENIEVKLGFDKVRHLIKEQCISTLGQSFVDKIRFSNNFELVDKLARQTAEFCEILSANEGFPNQHFFDVQESLTKSAVENSFLLESEFYDLKLSLKTISDCLKFFRKRNKEVYPNLRELSEAIIFEENLIDQIEMIIDEKGKIRDNASYELRRIRTQLIAEHNNLRKRLEYIIKTAKNEGFTKEDATMTVRDGRMVIPVSAEFKRKIKGVVHDESATGQTVFLEPAEIFDLNNEIRELEYQEKREIIRILTALTNQVRPHVLNLKKAYNFLGLMDFIRAKAKFALKTDSLNPHFEKKSVVRWYKAKHPLLFLNHEAQGKKTIPLSIELGEKGRILLISGPNAGGKSVALKTVGLLQYMYQCGLLVPMGEGSTMGLFKDIFIDMGDEQSIENDLSTYSSHLTNMRHFLNFSEKYSLILIDEFGTGTEPTMGGAIAEAILLQLNQLKSFGVITTHYTNLKFVAENTEGLINGAMLFDGKNLEPLYELEIGKPGSSFAFEIAHKIGLPNKVIEQARQNAGTQQVNFDRLLVELEAEKKQFTFQNRVIAEKEKKLNDVTAEYTKLKDYIENEKKRILNKAKEDAQKLFQVANQKIEQAIREIKETKAEKEPTKEIRKELEIFVQETLKIESVVLQDEEESEEIEVIQGTIQIGDMVRIKGQTTLGLVQNIRGKDAEIMLGDLKSTIKMNRLEKISRKELRKQKKEVAQSIKGIDMNARMSNFSFNLDLRGKRGEEAMVDLANFMDNALLLGYQELRIVHGKGDGILRKLIREQLRKYKEVESLTDEHADRGGDGVTIVVLK